MDFHVLLVAFLLTLGAGLSTGIGSLIAFFAKTTNRKFLSFTLGFSAGVMIYVSLVEIFSKARLSFAEQWGTKWGYFWAFVFFLVGILVIALIDKLIPSYENPHEIHGVEELSQKERESHQLHRMGIFAALAIGIHNFPEGLATFVSALHSPAMGIAIASAIALHNIPEGIAVSIPIYYATGNRKKALVYSFLSGLAEPVGAVIGFLFLMPFLSSFVFGALFASVAGIMVFISLDELLPTAEKYGEHHLSIYGVISGMAVMGFSLFLFS